MCVCVVVTTCFSSGELIRPLEPAERCVTMKVTSSIPACNVTLVTLRQTASLLSCLVPVFGTADTAAGTLLCSLSLNYSMKSYLLQVNVLLQNIWRAICHTSRKDGEEIKEWGNQKIFFKTSPPSLFCITHMISSEDPINPRGELWSPSQVPSSLRVMREMRSAVFIPSWGRGDLVDPVPGEVAVIAFSVEIIGQDTGGARVSV